MPLPNINSGFDIEAEISPLSLQQFISQLWENGIIEQTFLLDPQNNEVDRVTIMIDPDAERNYSHNENWTQAELHPAQSDAFKTACLHDDDYPGELIIQVRLLVHIQGGGFDVRESVEVFLHVKEDINTQTIHLLAEQFRAAYAEWSIVAPDFRDDPPTLGWDQFLYIRTAEFTNSQLILSGLISAIGQVIDVGKCDLIDDPIERQACYDDVYSRPANYHFDLLLETINGQIYSTLDTTVRSNFSGLGGFLVNNEDTLQLVQLGRIGLNALDDGALGVYLNTRQKTDLGFFRDHGRGNPRSGTSLRPFVADPDDPGSTTNFTESPGFIGVATAPGYLDRLVPDLIEKYIQQQRVEAGDVDEATARAELIGDNYPLHIDGDLLDIDTFDFKLRSIQIKSTEKKFRLEEDEDKVKLPALELKAKVNPKLGEHLKLTKNNFLLYVVPYLKHDILSDSNKLRVFLQSNLRIDVAAGLSIGGVLLPGLGQFVNYLISAIVTLVGKKEMLSGDVKDIFGLDIPSGLHLLSKRWDALYSVALGWKFDLSEALVTGEKGEAQIRLRASTTADRINQPVDRTVLRSVLPYDAEGNLTFEQNPVETHLLFRTPGIVEPTELLPDPEPFVNADGELELPEPIIGRLSRPYFTYDRDEFSMEEEDEEFGLNRVFRIRLKDAPGSLEDRILYDKVRRTAVFYPICALRDDTRIQLLGLYSSWELEDFKSQVYSDEKSRLIIEKMEELAAAAGNNLDDLTDDQRIAIRIAATGLVESSGVLAEFWKNIASEALSAVEDYPGELRLQVSPLALADMVDMRYAIMPGYVHVRQSSGEVYFRNIPNADTSDNLENLDTCRQLHFDVEEEDRETPSRE